MYLTIASDSPNSRGLAGIGMLNGELGPYGCQQPGGHLPTPKVPNSALHVRTPLPATSARAAGPVASSGASAHVSTTASAASGRARASTPRGPAHARPIAAVPGHLAVRERVAPNSNLASPRR